MPRVEEVPPWVNLEALASEGAEWLLSLWEEPLIRWPVSRAAWMGDVAPHEEAMEPGREAARASAPVLQVQAPSGDALPVAGQVAEAVEGVEWAADLRHAVDPGRRS